MFYSNSFYEICLSEDPPSTGSDVEKQLLEAARSGDMEVVKVMKYVRHYSEQLSIYLTVNFLPCAHLYLAIMAFKWNFKVLFHQQYIYFNPFNPRINRGDMYV